MKRRFITGICCSVLLLASCNKNEAPIGSQNDLPSSLNAQGEPYSPQIFIGKGADAEFSRFANKVPGFGGMYIDPDGTPVIYVKNPGRDARLLQELQGQVQRISAHRERTKGNKPVKKQPQNYVLKKANYDYRDLASAKIKLRDLLSDSRLTGIDIREDLNMVELLVRSEADIPGVQEAAKRLSLPDRMIHVTTRPPQQYTRTLRDRANPNYPLVGGLQTAGNLTCTMGFNATIEKDGVSKYGMITASHCSDNSIGVVTGTRFVQPLNYGFYDTIGYETVDPATFPCAKSAKCRYSDSIFIEYQPNLITNPSALAAPTSLSNSSSFNLNIYEDSFYFIQTASEIEYYGDTLYKIGRTSGMQAGTITRTCVDSTPVDGVVYLCQMEANAYNAEGDSGGPVFSVNRDNTINLLGLTSGRPGIIPSLIYHPWYQIADDFYREGYGLYF